MANTEFSKGFTPIEPTHRVHSYPKADTNAMAIGDLVRLSGGKIVVAGPDTPAIGGLVGLTDPDGVPANVVDAADGLDGWVCDVADDPDQVFGCRMDDTDVQADDIGHGVGTVWGLANGFNGLSTTKLDGASVGTATQCKLLGKVMAQDNEYGPYCDWLVTINNHQLRNITITQQSDKKGKGKKAA